MHLRTTILQRELTCSSIDKSSSRSTPRSRTTRCTFQLGNAASIASLSILERACSVPSQMNSVLSGFSLNRLEDIHVCTSSTIAWIFDTHASASDGWHVEYSWASSAYW